MSDRELLSAMSGLLDRKLKHELEPIKEDVHSLKEDVSVLKEDVSVLKEDVSVLKEDVSVLKEDVQKLDQRMTRMEVHIENVTDKNIAHLIEVFEPAAKTYMEKAAEIETMQEDIAVMKCAIQEHSEKLQKIS